MSNSSLVNYTHLSRNNYNIRKNATYNPTGKIDAIVIHHAACLASVEGLGRGFDGSREVSANYGIGTDARVGLYVNEDCRSWCSSDRGIDFRAITIEVANSTLAPTWQVSDAVYEKLIDLCADICQRNGFRLNYTGDKSGNLHMHKWYIGTLCPGPYLETKFADIANRVNAKVDGKVPAPVKPVYTGNPYNEPSYNLQYSKLYNEDNKWAQWHLVRLGFLPSDAIDGYFGDNTLNAVKTAQKAFGIAVDGIVGVNTRAKLKEDSAPAQKKSSYPEPTVLLDISKVGECRDDVKWVQTQLGVKGFGITVDGYFGKDTRAAVVRFQGAVGIGVDGVVGPETISKLK